MTKRRRIPHAVIQAYEAGDNDTLRALLDLKPWEVRHPQRHANGN
jgi:hypothetical protein